MNLHHFLYNEAKSRGPREAAAAVVVAARERSTAENWESAVDYYARELADRDLMFNREMALTKNRLAEMEGCADLSGRSERRCASGLRPELVRALEAAAPHYRARYWAQHDATNREWIAVATPFVQRHGAALARQLAAIYGQQWPAEQLLVDVTYVSHRSGAYTTLDPLHITISSSVRANQDRAALEVLFHEASHALAESVRHAIIRECRARQRPIPRDLWHAVLFYTTGEVVRREFGSEDGAYTPYAFRHGLFARGWQGYLNVLERHWQAYLDGRLSFERAIARMVDGL